MLKNAIILCLLLLSVVIVRAQEDSLNNAGKYVQVGNWNLARIAIDAASENAETAKNPYTWYLKGFIYHEIYKKNEKNDPLSLSRIKAVESLGVSIKLDSKNEHLNENKSMLRYLASTFYNNAVKTLNETDYQIAVNNFNNYKKTKSIEDPAFDVKTREIEFKLALATVFEKKYYENRSENEDFFEKQEKLYSEVLELDPDNLSANKNFGLLYYNKAVHIINELEYDIPFDELVKMQDGFVALFKQGLPYEERAYQINPADKDVVKALMGIYFSLNEFSRYEEMKKLLEEMEGR